MTQFSLTLSPEAVVLSVSLFSSPSISLCLPLSLSPSSPLSFSFCLPPSSQSLPPLSLSHSLGSFILALNNFLAETNQR